MIIDCERCGVRGIACGDCVIGVLLDGVPGDGVSDLPSGAPIVQLNAPERRAIDVLADQGLVPRLRLVAGETRRASREIDDSQSSRDVG